jgi:HEAT repeat protein
MLEDESLKTTFIDLLRDEDGDIRRVAATALQTLDERRAIPLLVSSLEDPYVPFSAAAAKALCAFRVPAETLGRAHLRVFAAVVADPDFDELSTNLVPLVAEDPEGLELLQRIEVVGAERYKLKYAIERYTK